MIERRVVSPRPPVETVLLTFKEAMDFLRVSRSTLYRLMWSGQLRGHKVGSTWRFYERDLLAAVANPLDVPAAHDDDTEQYGDGAKRMAGVEAHVASEEDAHLRKGQE